MRFDHPVFICPEGPYSNRPNQRKQRQSYFTEGVIKSLCFYFHKPKTLGSLPMHYYHPVFGMAV